MFWHGGRGGIPLYLIAELKLSLNNVFKNTNTESKFYSYPLTKKDLIRIYRYRVKSYTKKKIKNLRNFKIRNISTTSYQLQLL